MHGTFYGTLFGIIDSGEAKGGGVQQGKVRAGPEGGRWQERAGRRGAPPGVAEVCRRPGPTHDGTQRLRGLAEGAERGKVNR